MTECPFLQESCKKFNPCSLAAEKEVKCPLLQCPAFACLSPERGTFTDPRDGRAYKTVKIGDQVWMAENLAFDYAGSKVYGNDLGNLAKYGRLYDWETAKKACPSGWRLPSKDEWAALEKAVGGSSNAGKHLKSASGWNSNGNGTDDYGFSALPGGYGSSDGSFSLVGDFGYWWSSSENDSDYAYYRYMYYGDADVLRYYGDKDYLYSVRCVQDGGAK
jgi:uncharacterized protein (TIGR02145 family)